MSNTRQEDLEDVSSLWFHVYLERIKFCFYLITLFFYWPYNPLWVCILQPSSGAITSSRTRFLDHTQRRATVGRTPLDECDQSVAETST